MHTSPERRLRALVLDDDLACVEALRGALEARGISVVSAGDGTTGVELLLRELLELDAIVIDLNLPQRDAASFADLIRRAGGERDLAIAVLESEDGSANRSRLLALGVDAVVERRAGPDAAAGAVVDAVSARRLASAEVPLSPLSPASPADRAAGGPLALRAA